MSIRTACALFTVLTSLLTCAATAQPTGKPDAPKKANAPEAAEWFLKGNDYYQGGGVKRDYAEAIKWYRKAADKGNPFAMIHLGRMHEDGLGVPKDEKAAVRWYRKAADKGDAVGMGSLGYMYENGLGVEKDEK